MPGVHGVRLCTVNSPTIMVLEAKSLSMQGRRGLEGTSHRFIAGLTFRPHTLTFTDLRTIQSYQFTQLACLWTGGREPEYLEGTHKLHSERPWPENRTLDLLAARQQ